ncbi:hypothetical protein A3K55_02640 [Candidatus Shapirobacteria bacterium RBG_13_44_7]|uniref:Uncharacterized protein n=1 Tax=Candidatus Shapirobacteria bacterium RBG_13_44_7 TaxID=1802149 RepID=A0A1F7SK11_9BACT|nr:MAG: hypothetical protein A3K55_02640 [Candidatus Shapirobacteria bacterium RBG_13_44_7]
MILFYAFSNRWGTNISRRTLSELQKIYPSPDINYQPIFYHPSQFFRKFIEYQNYPLILGLGDYYGHTNKIHLETQAKNSYNDQPIYPFSPILIDLSLPSVDNIDSQIFKISSNMGISNCNWIAYRTQLYLNQKNLPTHHLFLHLPQKSNASFLAAQISRLLQDNQII